MSIQGENVLYLFLNDAPFWTNMHSNDEEWLNILIISDILLWYDWWCNTGEKTVLPLKQTCCDLSLFGEMISLIQSTHFTVIPVTFPTTWVCQVKRQFSTYVVTLMLHYMFETAWLSNVWYPIIGTVGACILQKRFKM